MRSLVKKILLSFILLLVSEPGITFSQDSDVMIKYDTVRIKRTRIVKIATIRTVPKFILHVSGGLNVGALELTSHNGGFSREDYNTGKNFSVRNGYGFNIIGKIPLSKKGSFWLDIISGFDRFQSDLMTDNTEEGKVSYNSINFGLGIEYNFTPTHKVKYYFGFNPLFSFISGDAQLSNPDNNRVDVNITSSFRMGYQAFLGLDYALANNVGINCGLRFTHANLLLKNTETPIEDPNEFTPTSSVPLNDDSTVGPIQFGGWKQFAYFTGNVGISFFFNTKYRKYKIPEK
jgi:opacity protein-like surface antigen